MTAQEKLKIYYNKIFIKTKTYFNIEILFNTYIKRDFYQIFILLFNIT